MFLAGNLWIESFMIINTGTAINMQSLLYLKNGLRRINLPIFMNLFLHVFEK